MVAQLELIMRKSQNEGVTPILHMETLPIVKGKEEQEYGEYRTKDSILQIYDAVPAAIRTGKPYQTQLDPPPGPPSDAQGNFIPMSQWDPNNWPTHIHSPREQCDD